MAYLLEKLGSLKQENSYFNLQENCEVFYIPNRSKWRDLRHLCYFCLSSFSAISVGACCPSGLQWNFLSTEAFKSMVVPGNRKPCGSSVSSLVKRVKYWVWGQVLLLLLMFLDESKTFKHDHSQGVEQVSLLSMPHPLLCHSAGREAWSTALEPYSGTWLVPRKKNTSPRKDTSFSKDPVIICRLRLCTSEHGVRREEMHYTVESWPKRGRVCSNVKFSFSLCVMLFVVLDNLKNYKLPLWVNKSEDCCRHTESKIYAWDVMY